ncbi:MAG: DUF3574 domain-containing protein [Thermoanaerobaculia bacterium]
MRKVAVLLAVLVTACAHVAPVENAVVSDRLFCGLSVPDGGIVTQTELDAFVKEVVEPHFPVGFTVWRARGHWKGGNEEVMILEIIHRHDADLDRAVREIAQEYRTRFRQEAVLRVTMPARMELTR